MKLSILASVSTAALLLAGAAAAQTPPPATNPLSAAGGTGEVATPETFDGRYQYGTIIKSNTFDSSLEAFNKENNGFVTERRNILREATDGSATRGTADVLINGGGTFPANNGAAFPGGYEGLATGSTGSTKLESDQIGNKAGVSQYGDNNSVLVDQDRGRSGWAAVEQGGNTNQASVEQIDNGSAALAGTSKNMVFVSQISTGTPTGNNRQFVTVTQDFTGGGSDAINAAVVLQGAQIEGINRRSGGTNNRAAVDQSGFGLDAVIVQGADANSGAGATGDNSGGNRGTVFQRGNTQKALIQQEAASTASVDQRGSGNEAAILQDEGVNHVARVYQQSFGNYAAISQDGTSLFGIGFGQSALVDQLGAANTVYVRQEALAEGSEVEIEQTSNDNIASVHQGGLAVDSYASILQNTRNGNFAAVSQLNARGNGIVNQNGTANFARVSQ